MTEPTALVIRCQTCGGIVLAHSPSRDVWLPLELWGRKVEWLPVDQLPQQEWCRGHE